MGRWQQPRRWRTGLLHDHQVPRHPVVEPAPGSAPCSEQSSSLNHEVPHSLAQKCYSERPAVGYAVTPLPSDDNAEVVPPSLLDSGRVTPFRPFDTEGDVQSQTSSATHSLNASLDNPELTASAQSVPLTGPMDVQATVGSSYTVFIVAPFLLCCARGSCPKEMILTHFLLLSETVRVF